MDMSVWYLVGAVLVFFIWRSSWARGGIVNEQDMCDALKSGKIGGYASDVMENELAAGGLTECAGFDSPLFQCDNFIVSPHLGAQTVDAARDIGAHIISKVKETMELK